MCTKRLLTQLRLVLIIQVLISKCKILTFLFKRQNFAFEYYSFANKDVLADFKITD